MGTGVTPSSVSKTGHQLSVKEHIESSNLAVLKLDKRQDVLTVVQNLKNDPEVEFVEPNYQRYPSNLSSSVNDPDAYNLWGLMNSGQMVFGHSGTVDADIDAPEAWEIDEGSESVVVAVIDTGVYYNHPDLEANMWDGSSCKDENGVAIAGGCPNHGWDYHFTGASDNNPLPTSSSHGTHIAGTIAATKNNQVGVVGVAPKVKIMAIKFGFDIASEIKAIDFARVNGAKVINASYGGTGYSQAEREAIARFRDAGGLFIAAAGNSFSNTDLDDNYPSKHPLDNIISVAASDSDDEIADFSNYGATSVDLSAPGVNIYSTSAVSSEDAFDESFNDEAVGTTLPSGWVASGGNWQIVDTSDPNWGKVLYADTLPFYTNNANSIVTSPVINLSGSAGSSLEFWLRCDTEYFNQSWGEGWRDYLSLEISSDGVNFLEWERWDEEFIDGDSNEGNTPPVAFISLPIFPDFSTADFKFRFKWTTNDSNNNYEGCLVDDLRIQRSNINTGENYEFMSGTSMAAPHVAGAAALLFSQASNLSSSQIKNIILASGDPISSQSGKTLTGKRLNLRQALERVSDSDSILKVLGLVDDPSPVKSKTWTWMASRDGAKFRYAVDQSPTKIFDPVTNPLEDYTSTTSATISGGTGTYYLHVQAQSEDGLEESSVITVSAILDNTAPPSVSSPITPTPTPASISSPISSPIDPPVDPNSAIFVWNNVTDEVSGVAHYVWELVDSVTGTVVDAGATIYNGVWLFLTDGIWNFLVKAEDNAGNISSVLSLFKTMDTTAPVGSITSPISNSHHKTPPTFSVDTSDNLSGVESVRFQYKDNSNFSVNGGGGESTGFTDLNTDTEAPFVADWTGVTLTTNTIYDVQVVITDNFSNQQTVGGVFFTYDTTLPLAPIVNQPTATLVNADSVTLTGSAEPNSTVKVYRDGEVVGSQDLSLVDLLPQGGGGDRDFSITVSLLQNQINNFTITTTDQAGNESTPSSVNPITEDSTAPGIVSYTLDRTKISSQVSFGINDEASFDLNFSEVVTADFDILDASGNKVKDIYAATVTNPQAKIWDGTNNSGVLVPDGVYTIKISITDAVGNNLTDTSKTITVDNDILTLDPISNQTIDESAGFSFDASSNDTDEEGRAVTYALTTAPTGASIDSATGVFSWRPTETQGSDSYPVTIRASSGGVTKTQSFSITVNEVNEAPIADDKALNVNQEQSETVTLTATDTDVPVQALTFSILTNPTHGTATLSGTQLTYTPFNDDYVGADTLTYQVNDGTLTDTATVNITINEVDQVDLGVVTNVATGQDEVKISDLPTSDSAVINIPSGLDNVVLDLTGLDNVVGDNRVVTLPDALTVNSVTDYGDVTLNLPAGLVITADATDWNGNLTAPTDSSFNFSLPLGSNQSISDIAVIEVGFGNVPLGLSSAARVQIAGQAGVSAGYVRNGNFTEITTVCTSDNQAAVDAQLLASGDCKLSVGLDLVIWTKHFTQFVAYDVVTNNPSSNSSSSSSSSSGNSGTGKSCDSAKPASAPRLLSATAGTNSVTLTWSKASDPVTYYLITYGDGPGKQQYGNPNVGGKDTTSYTVFGLSGGTTYYFKVRAGNDCMPGDFSNELSARVGGGRVSTPATGFTAGVLGAKTTPKSQTPTEVVSDAEVLGEESEANESKSEDGFSFEADQSIETEDKSNVGFFGTIGNFFGGIFKFFGGLFGN